MTADVFYRRLVIELSTTSTAASVGLAAACVDVREARLIELEAQS